MRWSGGARRDVHLRSLQNGDEQPGCMRPDNIRKRAVGWKKMFRKGKKKRRRNLLFRCHSLSIGFVVWEILPE